MTNPKHIATRSVGCTNDGTLYVNGVESCRLTKADFEDFVDDLFMKLRESLETGETDILRLLEAIDPTEYDYSEEPCDTCGDTVDHMTWKF